MKMKKVDQLHTYLPLFDAHGTRGKCISQKSKPFLLNTFGNFIFIFNAEYNFAPISKLLYVFFFNIFCKTPLGIIKGIVASHSSYLDRKQKKKVLFCMTLLSKIRAESKVFCVRVGN